MARRFQPLNIHVPCFHWVTVDPDRKLINP